MSVTQSDIFSFRLLINDPAGFIYFSEVASLPATYDDQTAYFLTSDERYYSSAGKISLRVSDTEITSWLSLGEAVAKVKAYEAIIARIGSEMIISSTSTGTESTSFTSLNDLLRYYKSLLSSAKDDATTRSCARWATSPNKTIGV